MKILQSVFLVSLWALAAGCSKNNGAPQPATVATPSEIGFAATTATHVTITGKADPGSTIRIGYDHERGEILTRVTAGADGSFSVTVERLVGYDQELTAFASAGGIVSESVKIGTIPAKDRYSEGWDTAREMLTSARWISDQSVSRVVINTTLPTPPYALFATVAQKYFDFKPGGGFRFEVISPVQFTHNDGTWSMDENGVIEINTAIPVGALKIENAEIQRLDEERLTLLARISDGLFVLSFNH